MMPYAAMIAPEEKSLKRWFIIATLISTILGTFTASMTLTDKILDKRKLFGSQAKPKAIADVAGSEIRVLKERLAKQEVEREKLQAQVAQLQQTIVLVLQIVLKTGGSNGRLVDNEEDLKELIQSRGGGIGDVTRTCSDGTATL